MQYSHDDSYYPGGFTVSQFNQDHGANPQHLFIGEQMLFKANKSIWWVIMFRLWCWGLSVGGCFMIQICLNCGWFNWVAFNKCYLLFTILLTAIGSLRRFFPKQTHGSTKRLLPLVFRWLGYVYNSAELFWKIKCTILFLFKYLLRPMYNISYASNNFEMNIDVNFWPE